MSTNPEVIKSSKEFKEAALKLTKEMYGEQAEHFMNLVYSQNAQSDILNAMLDLAVAMPTIDNKEHAQTMFNAYLDAFSTVQSQITGQAAALTSLTEEVSLAVFNKANETYETIKEQLQAPNETND